MTLRLFGALLALPLVSAAAPPEDYAEPYRILQQANRTLDPSLAASAYASDGELIFDGDTAVSWREWLTWRAGGSRSILVKTLSGSRLASDLGEIVRDLNVVA